MRDLLRQAVRLLSWSRNLGVCLREGGGDARRELDTTLEVVLIYEILAHFLNSYGKRQPSAQ